MKYAIIQSGGKQYRAVEGETLEVDRLPVEAGANFRLDQILLLADGETITVGTPLIKDFPVWTKVVEHFKGKKVTIFNYSPKKRIRVKTGHRQNYTRLLVEQIGGPEPTEKVKKVVKAKAKGESANLEVEEPVEIETIALKEKKPAMKTAAKTEKTSAPKVKAAPSKVVEKKPATKSKAAPAKATEKKPAKVTPKPAAKKPATKKPSATKK
jgi:large subunit ribosomal protein L21